MKFIFDTTDRLKGWQSAYPDCLLLISEATKPLPNLNTDDIVFVHRKDFDQEVTHTLEFKKRLLEIVGKKLCPPRLILYSGVGWNSVSCESVKALVMQQLPGYPPDRIIPLAVAISQGIEGVDLRQRVDEFMTQVALRETTNVEPNGALKAQAQRREGNLALRLLCEAWVFNDGKEYEVYDCVTIHAPVRPEDWFGPFGKSASEVAANQIAQEMVLPDAQQKVAGFLKWIVNNPNVNDQGELKTKVPALEQALEDAIKTLSQ